MEKMQKSKIYARIPLPALRATYPPGEGIAHRNDSSINRNFLPMAKKEQTAATVCSFWGSVALTGKLFFFQRIQHLGI